MPLFDFYCKNCDLEFELLLMGSEKPLCPQCGKRNLKKKMSSFSVGGRSQAGGGSSGSGCSGCSGGSCSTCR